MQPLLLSGLSAFLFSLLLTPVCRTIFRRLGIFDCPTENRKIHDRPIPRVGGVVLVVSLAAAYAVTRLFGGVDLGAGAALELAVKVFPGAAVIFVVGLLDDLISLRPWQKLGGQLVGAAWAYWSGVRVIGAAGYSAESWLTLPLTLFWLVLCTNAFNLIDGVDGLATGVALFGTLTTMVAAIMQHNFALVAVTLPLVGFLLGFLRYNFNPATVFLGDSGSLLLGFLLGCFGVIWSQKSATLLGMTAPLMAMFVPLLDVGLSVLRRFLRHQPIFGADRGHIHHRLLDRGMTPRRAVLLLYGVCSLGAIVSLLQTTVHQQYSGLIVLLFCASAWIGIQHLGYVEFNLASRMLLAGSFQRMLDMQIRLRKFEQALAATLTTDDCRQVIKDACQTFGFSGVIVSFRDYEFREDLPGADLDARWTIRIPLGDRDYVNIMRPFDSAEQSLSLVPLVEILRKRLPAKLDSLALNRERVMAHSAN